ncbi:MAG: hypothetical protein H6563_08195 [Lewinellaceae bacterium]|nr:hypothetical protein [Lewinellaceae bacterium]
MTRYFLLIFCILVYLPLIGQNSDNRLSLERKYDLKQIFQGHVFTDDTGHYLYLNQYHHLESGTPGGQASVIFEKYDPKFNLIYSKDLESFEPQAHSVGITHFNGHFFWMWKKRTNGNSPIELNLTQISPEGEAGRTILVGKSQFDSGYTMPETEWKTSYDGSKLFMMTTFDQDEGNRKINLHIAILNEQLESLNVHQYELPYTEKQIDIQKWTVDNNGNVYLLAKVYVDNRGKETKRNDEWLAAYDMILFRFGQGSTSAVESILNLEGVFTKVADIEISPQGELYGAGLFSNKPNGNIQGLFFLKIDPLNGSVITQTKKEFSKADFDRMNSKYLGITEGKLGLDLMFQIGDILFLENGSIFITIEKNTGGLNVDASGGGAMSYRSTDIIVFHFEGGGRFKEIYIIPKDQFSDAGGFLGHIAFSHKEKVYFIYNESKNNLKKTIDSPHSMVQFLEKAVVVVTSIDTKGTIERSPLMDANVIGRPIAIEYCSLIDHDSLFFVTKKSKFLTTYLQFGQIPLPKL